MSAGRVVLLPAPIGTLIVALFGLDLAWNLWGLTSTTQAETISAFFAGQNTIRVAVDLAGMAIGGAFLAVPTFAAMQVGQKKITVPVSSVQPMSFPPCSSLSAWRWSPCCRSSACRSRPSS
jgi:hypothetical protein